MSQPKEQQRTESQPDKSPDAKVIGAEQLFQGQREVYIDHDGERYRLRITRRNKLILQK